jgi:hypothetical protein
MKNDKLGVEHRGIRTVDIGKVGGSGFTGSGALLKKNAKNKN